MSDKNDENELILLTFKQLRALLGLSRTFIWRLQRRGEFPAHVKVGRRRIAWRRADVEQWIASR